MEFIFLFISFLLGSFPSAHIVSKMQGIDIKKMGSGNPGATNVLRSVGWKSGFIVLIIDVGKGILPFFLFPLFSIESAFLEKEWILLLGGVFSILGHIFSPFLGFQGGKGIATSIGIYLYLLPIPCLMSAVLGLIVVYWKKIASLGSIAGFFFLPIFYRLYEGDNYSSKLFILVVFNFFLVLFTHHENIKRIIDGTELKFKNKTNVN